MIDIAGHKVLRGRNKDSLKRRALASLASKLRAMCRQQGINPKTLGLSLLGLGQEMLRDKRGG